jgi:hypothetical protein
MVGIEWSYDPESYSDGSSDTGGVSLADIKGDDPG